MKFIVSENAGATECGRETGRSKVQNRLLEAGILSAILLGGAALRLLYWKYNVLIPSRDGIGYAAQIAAWYQTGSFDAIGAPLLLAHSATPPFLYAMGRLLMGFGCSQYGGVFLVDIVFGSVLPLVMFGCGRRLWPENKKLAYLAALLTALHPTLIAYSADILREISFLFFAACGFYFWLGMLQRKKALQALLSGCMIAMATLCRYEGFEFYPIAVFTLGISIFYREFSWLQALRFAGILVLGAIAGYCVFFWLAQIPGDYILGFFGKIFRYFGMNA